MRDVFRFRAGCSSKSTVPAFSSFSDKNLLAEVSFVRQRRAVCPAKRSNFCEVPGVLQQTSMKLPRNSGISKPMVCQPMVCVGVAFHENHGNHENDEIDEHNLDNYKQGVE